MIRNGPKRTISAIVGLGLDLGRYSFSLTNIEAGFDHRMDGGQWTPASRARYNLRDTVARCTTQVIPTYKHERSNYCMHL